MACLRTRLSFECHCSSSTQRFKMIVFVTLCVLFGGINSSIIESPYDTIVVGLGAAGATAASTLARAGRHVLALDAQSRVGGRVWTTPFRHGVVEAGAEWIHGQVHSRVYELALKRNVSVSLQEPALSARRSDGAALDPPLADLLRYGLEVIDEDSDVNEPKGQFVERRLRDYLQTKNPELLNDKDALESLFYLLNLVVDSLEGSNDWNDVTALRGYEQLQGTQSGSFHRYGYKTFFEILLNTYDDGLGLPTLNKWLNEEVTTVEWSDSGVVVACADGRRYSADNVIVTVSLGVLKERHSSLFSPPLPQDKVSAIELLPMGLVNKIILQFKKSRPAEGYMLFYWTPEDRRLVPEEDKWITQVVGLSAPSGSYNTLTLWVLGEAAKLVETLPEEVIKAKAVELLQRFLGSDIRVSHPVAMIRTTWYSNPFTRGSYSYDNVEVAKHPGLRATLAAPLSAGGAPRVLFAGEATDPTHYATVHGASDSGYREAQRLLSLLPKIKKAGNGFYH